MYANRNDLANAIASRLRAQEQELRAFWTASKPVRHFIVDDLLDASWVKSLAERFPASDSMMHLSSIRERKRVGVQLDKYDASVRECLLAFQAQPVIDAVAAITGCKETVADPTFYASGVSVMSAGDFLNPHIDNSHDGDRVRYRVLNLLFYVTPDWSLANGGNLELWDRDVKTPRVVESKFNRLVVMETHQQAWHSVNAVRVDNDRRCVSNYYFSAQPPGGRPYFNVTTFTGRPEEPVKRMVLKVLDGIVLNTLGRTMPFLTKRNKHRLRTPAKS